MNIQARILTAFSKQIEQLRVESAPKGDLDSQDHIDKEGKCSYLILENDLKIIGSIRISSSTSSILKHWSNNKFPFPYATNIAELTKGVVSHEYRLKGLYKLMLLETLLRLPELGYSMATAAIRPSLSHRSFLEMLGFKEYQKTILFGDKNASFEVIPIFLNYINLDLIKEKYISHINSLNHANTVVQSDFLARLESITHSSNSQKINPS